MTGADALCATLLDHGVDTCFANPGTSEMHFVAALDRRPEMRCLPGLFEGVVTGAADGYARMAGKPAATLLHMGPGLANGLANLHNAKRARTMMVNIVGEHATHHRPYDAPLASDIESLARSVSRWVRTIQSADDVARDTACAIAQAKAQHGISTLVLPADCAWNTTGQRSEPLPVPGAAMPSGATIDAAVRAIRSGRPTLLLLGNGALCGEALVTAGRIAQATGVAIMADPQAGRIERGAGRVPLARLPQGVDTAISALKSVEQLILVGARAPVCFFAYPGRPGRPTPEDCIVHTLAAPAGAAAAALQALAAALGVGARAQPEFQKLDRPAVPAGRLTSEAVMATVAALMPENAIVCDESITAGQHLERLLRGAPAHDYLPLTGGAIGIGLPLALGAAVACPERKVICLQADGSGMYTVQALWTQAREGLDVVNVILANRSYEILRGELRRVGAGDPGRNARRMLDIDDPALDWVSMARGMGMEAARVETPRALADVLRSAFGRAGPMLIEARV
ncbi:acetolactate synthase large subunit [Bordetella sp. BOR01]|uniref:acetolactate synthase large subunit n=1 Tax=Bordetella sp. BOR01 TaxID=2854779 RepID=UPI001C481CC6|nr:acetolactate synthase large subunit [Bordetella sp. BOR01]MBV7483821.1 acetolactate synthase large subunit [Bordetella sp. BOR01]